ncbi:MAG: hypothetical protein ACKOX3_01430 [Bacteroidota bacterium]
MKKIVLSLAFCVTGIFANAQHTVVMKDGSKLNGELQSIQNNTVTFFYKGSNITFNVGEISSILFDGTVGGASSVSTTTTKGSTFVMPGRKLTRQPKIDNLTMEKGIVVVNITIDKYGNVIKAEPGADGTTTTSTYLLTKAEQAAKSSMFDGGTTFPLQQKGTITITF